MIETMKTTHTHRGHCQICGAIQALNNDSGNVAKHGYTTTWGYFNGTCPGSDKLSLHTQRSLTDALIVTLNNDAAEADARAEMLKVGTRHPLRCRGIGSTFTNGKYVENTIAWEDADKWQRKSAVDSAISTEVLAAKNARAYADFIGTLATSIFDKVAPFPTKAKVAPLAVGDMTTRGVILEIATQVARGCGPYMNGRHIPHARLKGVSGADYWWPVRTLKRPKV